MVRLNQFVAAVLAAVAIAFVAVQWRAIQTENVNWDEFALLSRTEATARTGRVQSAGRPGLATLMLLPLVDMCTDTIETVVTARKVWMGFTLGYLGGVFALVAALTRRRPGWWHGPALAVALIALVPVFLRWSLQVRTDQPALMFACWGAVLLLASPGRRMWAAAAGVLFALGYFSSQKAVYVVALAGVLLLMRLARDGSLRSIQWRQGLEVLTIAAAGALAAVGVYSVAVTRFFIPPTPLSVEGTLNTFAFYRAVFGYRAYEAMLPTLLAHLLLLAVVLAAMVVSVRRGPRHHAALIAAGLVLLLGVAVGRFHGGAFPYFWMTLGLFPAVGIALALDAVLESFAGLGRAIVVIAALLLLVSAVPAAMNRQDTQKVQREALAFIDRNFEPAARGFQAEGALLCRRDPNPFPVYFADTVGRLFRGVRGRLLAQAFIDEFRTRPISFMIAQRLYRFPPPIDEFWSAHYVVYRDEVMIPGRAVQGAAGDVVEFEAIVPGAYRWLPATPGARLSRRGVAIEPGGVFVLERGVATFTLMDNATGMLALAVEDDPVPSAANFYDPVAIHELDPLYPRF
jgi:hypothetical protein